jgi:predicted type IV restriction endonuclease
MNKGRGVMEEKIKELIESIKSNQKLTSYDEAATKQTIVLRILSICGWDIFDGNEVYPEYPADSFNIDYSLRIKSANKVFIEVKRVREDLLKHQEQLLNYSFKKGIKLSILTNGVSWWFYLPLTEGNWDQRRFYSIDLLQEESIDEMLMFIGLLNKENVVSGQSIENAEELIKNKKKAFIIRTALPKVWNKIMTEKDEFFLDFFANEIEEDCGFAPDKKIIKAFFDNHKDRLILPENVKGTSVKGNLQNKKRFGIQNSDYGKTPRESSSLTNNSTAQDSIKPQPQDVTLEQLLMKSTQGIKDKYMIFKEYALGLSTDSEEKITKTYGCHYSYSPSKNKKMGFFWIMPGKAQLRFNFRKGKYPDKYNKIKQKGFGDYPELVFLEEEFSEEIIKYIKELISHAHKI